MYAEYEVLTIKIQCRLKEKLLWISFDFDFGFDFEYIFVVYLEDLLTFRRTNISFWKFMILISLKDLFMYI